MSVKKGMAVMTRAGTVFKRTLTSLDTIQPIFNMNTQLFLKELIMTFLCLCVLILILGKAGHSFFLILRLF